MSVISDLWTIVVYDIVARHTHLKYYYDDHTQNEVTRVVAARGASLDLPSGRFSVSGAGWQV